VVVKKNKRINTEVTEGTKAAEKRFEGVVVENAGSPMKTFSNV
jgi:hypothetical protein